MFPGHYFDWLLLGALITWGVVGIGRLLQFRARGIAVLVADRQRTAGQMAIDGVIAVCLLAWVYNVITYACQIPIQIAPAWLNSQVVDSVIIHGVGVLAVTVALELYAVAVWQLGESWRLGIDRASPGGLVTTGVYRWTRHPIYVAFDLLFVGSALATGRLVYFLLVIVWIPMMHALMLREEQFLAEQFGEAYREYVTRVGRYPNCPRKKDDKS